MADVKCEWIADIQKFSFYPVTKAGKDWFEYIVGAVPDKNEPYMQDKDTSMALTRKMLERGLVINSPHETSRFKEKLGFKASEKKPPIVNVNDIVVAPVPVPDKLDEWDTRRLCALGVVWDRPESFPPHWVEGRNKKEVTNA